jgi:hypothetical protein
MTKPLTERQQLARLKQVVQETEAAANRLIAVKNGRQRDLATIAEGSQRNLLGIAQSLKNVHDTWERAMEERDA